jgi:hypothetical protein
VKMWADSDTNDRAEKKNIFLKGPKKHCEVFSFKVMETPLEW